MKRINRMVLRRRILSLVLALAVGVTFIPAFGGPAFAGEEKGQTAGTSVDAAGAAAMLTLPEVYRAMESDADAGSIMQAQEGEDIQYCNVQVKINKKKNTCRLVGSILDEFAAAPYNLTFGRLYIDPQPAMYGTTQAFTGGTLVATINSPSIDYTIDMTAFDTGYHTVLLEVWMNGVLDYSLCLAKQYIPTNKIKIKPNYKGKYDVYKKSFKIRPYAVGKNQKDDLYLEYRLAKAKSKKAKKWKRSGYMQANLIELPTQITYKVGKLKSNKKYKTRLRYGGFYTYEGTYFGDGKDHFFGGPAKKSVTIKTGRSKAPAVRAVTVQAVNVKYHEHKVPGHYEWVGNSLIWFDPFIEKYYTSSFKVNIYLKKRPGAKGIYTDGHYLKGNKTYYTYTFTPYPNYYTKRPPSGLKTTKVAIRSYQNKAYGGWSPKAKIRNSFR